MKRLQGGRVTRLWVALAVLALLPSGARADKTRFGGRASADVGLLVSRDQVTRLAYDKPGFLLSATLFYAALNTLDVELRTRGGAFFSSKDEKGGLVAPALGFSVHPRERPLLPYASLHAGAAFTGTLVRPYFELNLGLDIRMSRLFVLGPMLGYGQVVQWNRAGDSTDARYLMFGLSLGLRPLPRVHAPPPPQTTRSPSVRPEPPVESDLPQPSEELVWLMEDSLPRTTQVELLAPVLFAFDSEELEPVGVAMLHEVAAELERRPDIELVAIHGYADRRGSAEYNTSLSYRRAARVLEWLVAHGIAPERLEIAADGASDFVEAGTTERAHEQNRRVVFRVLRMRAP